MSFSVLAPDWQRDFGRLNSTNQGARNFSLAAGLADFHCFFAHATVCLQSSKEVVLLYTLGNVLFLNLCMVASHMGP